jgi:hypothetical protein
MNRNDKIMATKINVLEYQIRSLQRKGNLQRKQSLLQKSTTEQKNKEVRVLSHLMLESAVMLFFDVRINGSVGQGAMF